MTDDSLDDVQSTVKGSCGVSHPNFKHWQECPNCAAIDLANYGSSSKLKGVDIEKFVGGSQSVYAKEIWNAAIEAAAKLYTESHGFLSAHMIRKLKK